MIIEEYIAYYAFIVLREDFFEIPFEENDMFFTIINQENREIADLVNFDINLKNKVIDCILERIYTHTKSRIEILDYEYSNIYFIKNDKEINLLELLLEEKNSEEDKEEDLERILEDFRK